MVTGWGIRRWGGPRKGWSERMECGRNERRGNVERRASAIKARDAYPRGG